MYVYVCMYVYGNLPEQKKVILGYPNFRGSIYWYPHTIFKKQNFFPTPKIILGKTKNFSVNL